jgi:hypothetical protein
MNVRDLEQIIDKHKQHNDQITSCMAQLVEVAVALEEQGDEDFVCSVLCSVTGVRLVAVTSS